MKTRSVVAVVGALGLLGGCRPEDQRTDSVDVEAIRAALHPEFAAHLDSGNAAYEEGEMETAIRHYRAATEVSPEEAAGWFGVYMTERARGNEHAADSALEQARKAAPGASLLRQNQEDSDR